jgi:hypothetical protein
MRGTSAPAAAMQVLPVLTGFVDTARSGALPAGTRAAYPWLEPISGMDDPVKGGFYMAADYVKYSMPIATSMTALALSLVRLAANAVDVCDEFCAACSSDVSGVNEMSDKQFLPYGAPVGS